MIETSGLPIVDVHCHPFVNEGELTPNRFVDLVSFPGDHRRGTTIYFFVRRSGLPRHSPAFSWRSYGHPGRV